MNIFFTAGSSNQAIEEVVPAIHIDKTKHKIIHARTTWEILRIIEEIVLKVKNEVKTQFSKRNLKDYIRITGNKHHFKYLRMIVS